MKLTTQVDAGEDMNATKGVTEYDIFTVQNSLKKIFKSVWQGKSGVDIALIS